MANSSAISEEEACLAPFLSESLYASNSGFVDGRLCALVGKTVCCLPCPQTDWLYADNFNVSTKAASWINVPGLACSMFLLVSFAALPVEKTHRHYLSICLAIATILMQLGFIIPLAAKPPQCADAITPNDMHSSATCAISGAFVLAGGWCGVMWSFMRALALHLQICWQVVMGKGWWGIPAVALALALIFSGVSFRFGDTCHINHRNGLADFWIPLLIFAAITVAMQVATFGYCIKVYLASLSDESTTTNSSGLPSYAGTLRTVSPRQAYRRVQRVVQLQWRGLTIVLIIIADVIFFSIVFVIMDNSETAVLNNPTKASSWLLCLAESGGDKDSCLGLADKLVVNEATVIAVLVLLSLNGMWLLLLMGRFSMFTGWYDFVKGRMCPEKEFVSVDARTFGKDTRSYEMLASGGKETGPRSPENVLTPISPAAGSGRRTPDYFGREAAYYKPTNSFSSPKPPQVGDAPSSTAQQHRPNPLSMNKF